MSLPTVGAAPTHEAQPKRSEKKEKSFVASVRLNGKLKQKRFPNTPEGKRDAKEWVTEVQHIRARWKAGLEVTQDISVKDYVKIFLSRKTKITRRNYGVGFTLLLRENPDLAKMKMSEVKKMHLQCIFGEHGTLNKRNAAPGTFNTRLANFKALFKEGMKEEVPVCLSNPLVFFSCQKPRPQKWKAIESKQDLDTLLQVCQRVRGGMHFPLLYLTLATGGRIASVLGWQWKDVDLECQTLRFAQMFSSEEDGLLKKGLKSRPNEVRTHAMGDTLTAYFRTLKAQSRWTNPDDFVIEGTRRWEPLRYETARKRLKAVERELERLTGHNWGLHFHQFRHTFAVQFLTRGGRIEELKEFLDHADIKTTQIYGKLQAEKMHTQANIVSFEPRKSDDRALTLVSSN